LAYTKDHNDHIVLTSSQWNERSFQYKVIPKGVLCIELTSKRKTKLKVGEGNKYYSQLPYICDIETELSNYYTKEEIDELIKGITVDLSDYYTKEEVDDIINGISIDLSEYAKKNEVLPRLNDLENKSHIHDNKSILDDITQDIIDNSHVHDNKEVLDNLTQNVIDNTHKHDNQNVLDEITEPFTMELKEKYDSITEYDDTEIRERLEDVEELSHAHSNKEVLDNLTQDVIDNSHNHINKTVLNNTTASFTIEDKAKLDSLRNYSNFVGATEESNGRSGLVPAPTSDDVEKFLKADGTWSKVSDANILVPGEGIYFTDNQQESKTEINLSKATNESLGGIIVGEGLNIDEDGVLNNSNIVYTLIDDAQNFQLLHNMPNDWTTNWMDYYELKYDQIITEPDVFDPTKHFKYENDNYVIGNINDTWEDNIWYDKHYVSLSDETFIIFDTDVYYSGKSQLLTDGENLEMTFSKINENFQYLEGKIDNKISVRMSQDNTECLILYK